MAQEYIWDREYQNSQLLAQSQEPNSEVKKFITWLRKNDFPLEGKAVLDLGSGNGKNALYCASLGAKVIGYEISDTARDAALRFAKEQKSTVEFIKHDIGTPYTTLADMSIDLVIDCTSSNSLNEAGRSTYFAEVSRVLKPGGYFFVRALCKEGDTHAKNLIKQHPGAEHDTYRMPEIGLVERVFSQEDFMTLYGAHFDILQLKKVTHYARFKNQPYKRNYWIAWMRKGQIGQN